MLCDRFGYFEDLFVNVRSLINDSSFLPDQVKTGKSGSAGVVNMRLHLIVFNVFVAVRAPSICSDFMYSRCVTYKISLRTSLCTLCPCISRLNPPTKRIDRSFVLSCIS